jgi:hypothetical protein
MELAAHKARRRAWDALGEEMAGVGLGFIYVLHSSVATVGQLQIKIFYATLSLPRR